MECENKKKCCKEKCGKYYILIAVFLILAIIGIVVGANANGTPVPTTRNANYTVTYEPGAGASATAITSEVVADSSYEIQQNTFESGNEFVEWNTKIDCTGTSYKPGDNITIDSNITLYAIWKSQIPSVNNVLETSNEVNGYGIAGSIIEVTFPKGTQVNTIVDEDGTWKVEVPTEEIPLVKDSEIIVTQTQKNMVKSDEAQTTVISATTKIK